MHPELVKAPSHARVYLDHLGSDYAPHIRSGLDWLGVGSQVRWGDTVFIKPNLTFPVFRKGVMTNPRCVEDLVVALRDYTNRIIVGEADSGGYNPFNIDEVLERTGMRALERRYDVKVVNLTRLPYRNLAFNYKGRWRAVPMSTLLLDDVDVFFTVPVPKTHMNTRVSMAVKNQWGCIPDPSMRLRLHPIFEKAIFEINASLRPSFAVVDGKYGLNRSGPMLGDVVPLDWLMLANDVYAADIVGCHLLGVSPNQVYYLRHAMQREGTVADVADCQLNRDYLPFRKEQFYLRRAWTDYPGLFAFRSSAIAYLAYYSPLAGILHKLLYLFRQPFYNYHQPARTHDGDLDDATV